MTTAARPQRSDGGFTLLEVMIATTISLLAVGAVTTAFIVGLTTSETTTTRVQATHDAELLSSYLPADVLSVSPTGVDTGASTATGCNDSVVSGEDGTKSRNWLRLQWSQDTGTAGGVSYYSSSYRTRSDGNGGWVLVRHFCSGADLTTATPSETIVAHELGDPVTGTAPEVSCTVTVGGASSVVPCGSGVEGVAVTLTTGSGYAFTVSGTRRTPAATPFVPSIVPDHFDLVLPANATAGAPFAVTVTAKDSAGATMTGYVGTVHFAVSDAQGSVPADAVFTAADSGVRSIGGFTLKTAGTATVTINDTLTTTATGVGTVTVAAASPSKLTLSNTACSTGFVDVGNSGTFTSFVGMVDAYGNAAKNTTGGAVTVNLTKTGTGGNVTPASLSLTVAADAAQTSTSFSATPPNGNKSLSVSAQAAGQTWTSVSCEVSS
jgi:prepilin-type N-terminal cleavage/methylation domain-containing protein